MFDLMLPKQFSVHLWGVAIAEGIGERSLSNFSLQLIQMF